MSSSISPPAASDGASCCSGVSTCCAPAAATCCPSHITPCCASDSSSSVAAAASWSPWSPDSLSYYTSIISELPTNPAGVYVDGLPAPAASFPRPDAADAGLKRGKGLYARAPISAGATVFTECKLAGQADLLSQRFGIHCDGCMRPLGSLEGQAARMAVLFRRQERVAAQAIERGDESPAPVDAPLPFREQVLAYARLRAAERAAGLTVGETDEETGVNTEALLAALQQQATAAVNAAGATGAATAAAWPLGDEVLEVKTVACPNGTGEVFCSRECQERAWRSYGRLFAPYAPYLVPQTAKHGQGHKHCGEEEEEEAHRHDHAHGHGHTDAPAGGCCGSKAAPAVTAATAAGKGCCGGEEEEEGHGQGHGHAHGEEKTVAVADGHGHEHAHAHGDGCCPPKPAADADADGVDDDDDDDDEEDGEGARAGEIETGAASEGDDDVDVDNRTHALAHAALLRSLRRFARRSNPLFMLAAKVLCGVALRWAGALTRRMRPQAQTAAAAAAGASADALATAVGTLSLAPTAAPVEAAPAAARAALMEALWPVLQFSQAPWWLQVAPPGPEEAGCCSSDGSCGSSCAPKQRAAKKSKAELEAEAAARAERFQIELHGLVTTAVRRMRPLLARFTRGVLAELGIPVRATARVPAPAYTGAAAAADDAAAATAAAVDGALSLRAPASVPRFGDNDELLSSVNDVSARARYYDEFETPAQLANAFTVGCLMGAFEMNNIGTAARSPALDYAEFVAGELSEEDLAGLYTRLSLLATGLPEGHPDAAIWRAALTTDGSTASGEAMPVDVSTLASFVASLKRRRAAAKAHFGAQRWANLTRRCVAHPAGTGLYAVGCCMNHSCEPNVAVAKTGDGRDDTTAFLALRDIAAGEELCISYIDDEDTLLRRERLERLQDYLFECNCTKCARVAAKAAAAAAKKSAGTAKKAAGTKKPKA